MNDEKPIDPKKLRTLLSVLIVRYQNEEIDDALDHIYRAMDEGKLNFD